MHIKCKLHAEEANSSTAVFLIQEAVAAEQTFEWEQEQGLIFQGYKKIEVNRRDRGELDH